MLGLYGRDRGLEPAIIRATGRIDSCKAVYDRIIAAGEIPFLGGFCHYYHGLVIGAASVTEIGKPDIVRIPAGTAVRFEPGETKTVDLVAIAGARVIRGGNAIADGAVTDQGRTRAGAAVHTLGFADRQESR